MDHSAEDTGGIIGTVTFCSYELTSPRAREIDQTLQTAHDLPRLVYESYIRELQILCLKRSIQKNNLVVLAGRSVMARILAGDTTYTGAVGYGALGTSATAVNAADTQLGAEVARKLFARRVRTNASIAFDYF